MNMTTEACDHAWEPVLDEDDETWRDSSGDMWIYAEGENNDIEAWSSSDGITWVNQGTVLACSDSWAEDLSSPVAIATPASIMMLFEGRDIRGNAHIGVARAPVSDPTEINITARNPRPIARRGPAMRRSRMSGIEVFAEAEHFDVPSMRGVT